MSKTNYFLKKKTMNVINELSINEKIKNNNALVPFVNVLENCSNLKFEYSDFSSKISNYYILKYKYENLNYFSYYLDKLISRKKYFFVIESFISGLQFLSKLHSAKISLLKINLNSIMFDRNFMLYFTDFSNAIDLNKFDHELCLNYCPFIYKMILTDSPLQAPVIEEPHFTIEQNRVLSNKLDSFLEEMTKLPLKDRVKKLIVLIPNWDVISYFMLFINVISSFKLHSIFINEFIDFYLNNLTLNTIMDIESIIYSFKSEHIKWNYDKFIKKI